MRGIILFAVHPINGIITADILRQKSVITRCIQRLQKSFQILIDSVFLRIAAVPFRRIGDVLPGILFIPLLERQIFEICRHAVHLLASVDGIEKEDVFVSVCRLHAKRAFEFFGNVTERDPIRQRIVPFGKSVLESVLHIVPPAALFEFLYGVSVLIPQRNDTCARAARVESARQSDVDIARTAIRRDVEKLRRNRLFYGDIARKFHLPAALAKLRTNNRLSRAQTLHITLMRRENNSVIYFPTDCTRVRFPVLLHFQPNGLFVRHNRKLGIV